MSETVQVERQVDLDATVDEVWHAITDERALSDWFGAEVDLDVTPGGAGRFEQPDGEVRSALVEEVDEGRRLTFRWWTEGDDDGPITSVAFDLAEGDGCTRLTVTERPLLLGAVASAVAPRAALHLGLGRLQAHVRHRVHA